MKRLLAFGAAALLSSLILSQPKDALANIVVKDGNGATQTIVTFAPSNLVPVSAPVDNTGTLFGTVGNPFNVTFSNTTLAVTGSFWQATQPVSLASLPALTTGANTIGKVDLLAHAGATMDAATGAALPASALQVGINTNNLTTTPHLCGSHVFKHITTAADTQLVAQSGSTTIYVCDYSFSFGGTGNAYLEKATSGTCATLSQIAGAWYGVANVAKTDANPFYRGLNTGASAQLCVNTSAAVSFDIDVYYDQY